jgi:hypothetical protein
MVPPLGEGWWRRVLTWRQRASRSASLEALLEAEGVGVEAEGEGLEAEGGGVRAARTCQRFDK